MARPTKCTKQLTDEIVGYVKAGNYIETACELAGISKQTYYNWIKVVEVEEKRVAENPKQRKVTQDKLIYFKFLDAVTRARACAEQSAIQTIREASQDDVPGDWKAAAWFLEHSFQDKYGKRKTEVTLDAKVKSTSVTAQLPVSDMSDELLKELERVMLAAAVGE